MLPLSGMEMKMHDFKVGDEVAVPSEFAQYKLHVEAGEVFIVDKKIGAELLHVSNDERSLEAHFSHFAHVKNK